MDPVLIGLLSAIGVAFVVMLAVAAPHLRHGLRRPTPPPTPHSRQPSAEPATPLSTPAVTAPAEPATPASAPAVTAPAEPARSPVGPEITPPVDCTPEDSRGVAARLRDGLVRLGHRLGPPRTGSRAGRGSQPPTGPAASDGAGTPDEAHRVIDRVIDLRTGDVPARGVDEPAPDPSRPAR